jgi:putative transposase
MSPFNPHIHHRRSIRIKGYDYSQAGLYFITICCHKMNCLFGHFENGMMFLSEYGQVVFNEWIKLPERYPNIELDVFQVMPNHFHGIIAIPVGATLAVAHYEMVAHNNLARVNHAPTGDAAPSGDTVSHDNGARVNRAPTIGNIVGSFKSLVANGCLEIYKSKNEMMGKLWQRNFWEHIIRNDESYSKITEYIRNNPVKWLDDKFNPDQNKL